MKYKKNSVLTTVLALMLVCGTTVAFAAGADHSNEGTLQNMDSTPYEGTLTDEINLADRRSYAEDEVKLIDGGQSQHNVYNIEDVEHIDATDLLEDAVRSDTTLISVSHDDESKFTPDEWQEILAQIEQGKIYWED